MRKKSIDQREAIQRTSLHLSPKYCETTDIPKRHFVPFKFLIDNSIFNYHLIEAITVSHTASSKERTHTLIQEVITDMLSSTSLIQNIGALRSSLERVNCNVEAETTRMKLAFESWKSMREQRAAIVIQSKFRAFYTRKKFIAIIHNRYIMQVLHPTIVIQAAWKRYRVVCIIKLRVFSKLITNYYSSNATRIARWYRSNLII